MDSKLLERLWRFLELPASSNIVESKSILKRKSDAHSMMVELGHGW